MSPNFISGFAPLFYLRAAMSSANALVRAFFGGDATVHPAVAPATVAVVAAGGAFVLFSSAPQCQSITRTRSFVGVFAMARAVLNSCSYNINTFRSRHTRAHEHTITGVLTELERRTALRILGVPLAITSSMKRLRLPSLAGTGWHKNSCRHQSVNKHAHIYLQWHHHLRIASRATWPQT